MSVWIALMRGQGKKGGGTGNRISGVIDDLRLLTAMRRMFVHQFPGHPRRCLDDREMRDCRLRNKIYDNFCGISTGFDIRTENILCAR
jgi:hypothetical protein